MSLDRVRLSHVSFIACRRCHGGGCPCCNGRGFDLGVAYTREARNAALADGPPTTTPPSQDPPGDPLAGGEKERNYL